MEDFKFEVRLIVVKEGCDYCRHSTLCLHLMALIPCDLSVTGKYFWRLTREKHLVSLRPAQIHRFWRGLPTNLDSVDAVYERPGDHKIVFFKGTVPNKIYISICDQILGGVFKCYKKKNFQYCQRASAIKGF